MASGKKKWSAVGAARSARQGRIATVEFLRTARLARECHASKLIATYQIHLKHLRRKKAATFALLAAMGYRPPFPEDWLEITELVISDEARYLSEAEIYILSPQMCDVVVAAALTLTTDDLQLLDEDDLPSQTGMLVLPHPLLIRTIVGDLSDDRVYTWRVPSHIPRAAKRGREEIPAVRTSAYNDTFGPVRPDSFVELSRVARAEGTPLPPFMLDAIRCVPFRFEPAARHRDDARNYVAAAHSVGAERRERLATEGKDETRVIGDYTPGAEIEDADNSFTPRFLYAFWRLCEQRIAEVTAAEVKHSAKVLADRAGVSPEVRVVELRQPHRAPANETPGGREWHHRWPVRMHRVRQWYPSEGRHKVIYRGPYIKGPADKPLLGGEVIRGMTR